MAGVRTNPQGFDCVLSTVVGYAGCRPSTEIYVTKTQSCFDRLANLSLQG
jgi:hypothetical protein